MAGASCRCSAWWQWVVLVVTLLVAFAASPRLAGADDPAHLISPGLPGQPQVSFKQYAGHVPVGGGKHIFYWFVTAQGGDPTKRPVAFWFNGGKHYQFAVQISIELARLVVSLQHAREFWTMRNSASAGWLWLATGHPGHDFKKTSQLAPPSIHGLL